MTHGINDSGENWSRRKRPAHTRERDIERRFAKLCKARGWLCWKLVSPQLRGVPDRLVLMPDGRSRFVELKAPGAKPTAQQLRRHAELRALGHRVTVIDSFDGAESFFAQ